MASAPDPNSQDRDLALRRYDIVLRYLATEVQVYWTRSQLFLVANAALLGFELNGLPVSSGVRTDKLIALIFAAGIGIALCLFWRGALSSGDGWMEHWKSALRLWEESAFGDVNLYRKRPDGVPKSRRAARKAALLFLWMWCLVAAYLISCLVLRLGCPHSMNLEPTHYQGLFG